MSIISELPEAEVQVDVNQRNQAAVECGRSQFKLNGLPADEFPELPSFEQATVVPGRSRICCVTVSAGRNMPFHGYDPLRVERHFPFFPQW